MTARIALPLAVAALALHLATAGRYGYFRDELYFIECAKHLAWGYVDQPPFVPFVAWLTTPVGYALVALRALPAIAAALCVALSIALVARLGGGVFARCLAGLLVLLMPAYLLLGSTLTTTSFEPLTWMLAIYCTVALVQSGGAWRWWIALALTFAFALYCKDSIALLAATLLLGLLATPQRRVLSLRLAAAIAVTAALLAPNLLWQGAHAWPMLEVLRGDAAHRPALQNGVALQYAGLARNAVAFIAEQFLYANPLAAPIWIAGIAAPFFMRSLRSIRFVSIAALLTIAVAIAMDAKGYYVIGVYGALTVVGCVWLERLAPAARAALAAAPVALALAALPFAVALLPVSGLLSYEEGLHLTSSAQPRLLQPVYAEEFGWRRLARDVAAQYLRLPRWKRATTAIYADTYGDASALNFFGPGYGLPPAISSQNSFYLWGPGANAGTTLIAVGATRIDRLRRYYRSVRLVATSFDPMRWIVEGPAPIYLCQEPIAPLRKIWPHLRWYGA
ncbi:MAG: glycosyltransferase family 39 protein [Candidatus Tyrphobacter sp.]